MDYIKRREYLINQIILMAGGWQTNGCKDEAMEKEIDSLMTQLHPVRKTALAILQQNLGEEAVA